MKEKLQHKTKPYSTGKRPTIF